MIKLTVVRGAELVTHKDIDRAEMAALLTLKTAGLETREAIAKAQAEFLEAKDVGDEDLGVLSKAGPWEQAQQAAMTKLTENGLNPDDLEFSLDVV